MQPINPTEQAFLDAIAAEPHDAARRLVYADWLEDRGDPRGEYLRVLDGLDTESVFVPRYWELKARRNELRWNIDSAWREHFGDGDVYLPLFTKLPADRQARWRLVDRFIDYWHEPLGPESGNTEDEIAEAEEHVGRPLLAAMKEFYRLAGRRIDTWSRQDELFELSRLGIPSGFDAIFFRAENQGVVGWGIRIRDLTQEDPAVSVTSRETGDWMERKDSPTLSAFAILTLLLETFWASRGAYDYADDNAFAEVRSRFDACDLPQHYGVLDPLEMYEGRDVICFLSGSDHFLGIGMRSDDAYDLLSDNLKQIYDAR